MPTFGYWTKLIFFNVMVLGGMLFLLEFAWRLYHSMSTCLSGACQYELLQQLTVRKLTPAPENLGLSRFDKELGYVPKEGFDAVISNEEDRWVNAKVTISNEGFRLNDNPEFFKKSDVLAVGDSFTFGDQVSNHDTWPACLERRLLKGVDNAGVFGYGAAQALKRALLKVKEKQYSTVILSVLVGQDFERDQLSYRSGFPRPAVIESGGGLQFDSVSDPNRPGTRYNPKANAIMVYLWKHSLLVSSIIDQNAIFNSKIDAKHPKAADKNEIIKWTLTLLAGLPVDRKILLLQYSKRNFSNKTNMLLQERKFIREKADALDIRLIDIFDELHKYDIEKLWGKPHHTPFGNAVVCEYLFEQGFK